MKTFNEFLVEMAGNFAIVGCEDNPNYQVWGARSDLRYKKKKKKKILKMKFNDWLEKKCHQIKQI